VLFSSTRRSSSPRRGRCGWWHLHRSSVGIAVCGASAGILCIPALLGGVYGGGLLGSKVGEGKNFLFSVIAQNSEGSTVAQNFRMLKRTTSKKLKKELAEISGLKMGQVKNIGK
tara:strand:- start:651 stop:992 length:342 start_codon:yes stop_codon:yes gene_type:complete